MEVRYDRSTSRNTLWRVVAGVVVAVGGGGGGVVVGIVVVVVVVVVVSDSCVRSALSPSRPPYSSSKLKNRSPPASKHPSAPPLSPSLHRSSSPSLPRSPTTPLVHAFMHSELDSWEAKALISYNPPKNANQKKIC